MSEFQLIQDFFNWPDKPAAVTTAVGDDAAVLQANSQSLVISVDTLISGVHFPEETPPEAIAHKALAVNLSDLAAMGATPAWFTLALTLPQYNERWLTRFSTSLQALARQAGIFLIGGDTTRGPLSITIQAMGHSPSGQSLLRSQAKPGDLLCVSGTLGDAAAGLAILQGRLTMSPAFQAYCIQRLNYPVARLELGQLLRTTAHSCMDISDGLLGDLAHLLKSSQVGARLYKAQIPLSQALASLPQSERLAFALSGGDDYELLFTLAPEQFAACWLAAQQQATRISCIGEITTEREQLTLDGDHVAWPAAYNHFE